MLFYDSSLLLGNFRESLNQGSQTRGPPRVSMRPGLSSKFKKVSKFIETFMLEMHVNGQKLAMAFGAFLCELRPSGHFLLLSAALGTFFHAHAALEWT